MKILVHISLNIFTSLFNYSVCNQSLDHARLPLLSAICLVKCWPPLNNHIVSHLLCLVAILPRLFGLFFFLFKNQSLIRNKKENEKGREKEGWRERKRKKGNKGRNITEGSYLFKIGSLPISLIMSLHLAHDCEASAL